MSPIVISIIGPHASESLQQILDRKEQDIKQFGFTLWFFRTTKLCTYADFMKHRPMQVYGVLPISTNGAKDTKAAIHACQYSFDNHNWLDFPTGFTPVTGNIQSNSIAFVVKNIQHNLIPKEIDLSDYKTSMDTPIKISQYTSTQIIHPHPSFTQEKKIRKYGCILNLDTQPVCFLHR